MEQTMYVDLSNHDLQVVKCVVVGDTGCGKTRLICARACDTHYSINQLMQTHVPTVWAIDHYRKDPQVLNRSWCTVDGLNVSLRLWDTFGYHDKDKRFAYARADVILVCFSVVRPRSLRNVLHHWYHEIQRLCPGVPIILCGCQVDLRYLYLDEDFRKLDKGPFFREITDDDVMPPERGRQVAKEIGAYYYETSVLAQYGIADVFMNVTRAALIYKREKHFWNTLGNLKRISRPICQKPHLPPKPPSPEMFVPPPQLDQDLERLLENQAYCDVIFVAQGVCMQAHRVCLLAASSVFEELFLTDLSSTVPADKSKSKPAPAKSHSSHSSHTHSAHRKPDANNPATSKIETAKLLDFEEVETSSVETADGSVRTADERGLPKHILNHTAFESIELQHCEDMYNPGSKILQTVVALSDSIKPQVFKNVLHYLYTGRCLANYDQLLEIRRIADMMGLKDLVYVVVNLLNNEGYLNTDMYMRFQTARMQRLRDLLIRKAVLSDVLFQVEDGTVAAHRCLLMARCDVMFGMFSYNFKESSLKLVHFPGVTKDTFTALQEYLYTGRCPLLADVDCLELIELANRMCLPRLLALTEQYIISELASADEANKDIVDDVLGLLEPAQMHNANQLASWCLWHVSSNYRNIYRKRSKHIQTLRPDNQIHLSKHRWPPLWYLKELDFYEKCLIDLEREKPIKSYLRRGSDDVDSGCLGFCSRRNRKLKCREDVVATVVGV